MCSCGDGARQQGEEARAVAAKNWEDEEEKRRKDAEQKKDDPTKKYTDEPWKQSQQSAQAMDNWKEAEARVKSADAGEAYPDGLPPAPEETKEAEDKDRAVPAEEVPKDKSCVSVGPWKSNANDYFCSTSCAQEDLRCATICKCGSANPNHLNVRLPAAAAALQSLSARRH
jgi:hypothetical protein